MLQLKKGDLLGSNAQTLVNTVNCVGVMGKGIALDFKRQYPEMYRDYAGRCGNGEVMPGVPYLYTAQSSPWILNFPTKNHWRSGSKIEFVRTGLELLIDQYAGWGIESIAVPPLGCGNGGLDWREVGPLIYEYLSAMNIPVELYVPPHVEADQEEFQRISASQHTVKQVQLALNLSELSPSGARRFA